ncbi:MAG: LysM peptidoglycan-binding domain-containing protein [Simkaniaceae bacterium]|nr:LysM peptidoglycan-binding domain-containing protein [Simkaniaceae bacterium]
MDSFEKNLHYHSRILIHALIISGTLNIALIATFVTFVVKERKEVVIPIAMEVPLKKVTLSNQEVIRNFSGMPYENLVQALYDETHVEEGQRRCDLALAFLGAYHHFDVERAFAGYPIERRVMLLDDEKKIILYPGLSDGRLEAVRNFARTEVWPLTPEGLFREIQMRSEIPQSLKEAFENTTEYFVVKRAFHRLPCSISEEALFSFITEGSWEEIKVLAEQIQKSPDGKVADFIPFLMPRMEKGSKLAAHLLVLLEKEYALKQLDDAQMKQLLALLAGETPACKAFLSEVKNSLRSDQMQGLADRLLENPPRRYIVQAGDSLWKLSIDYGTKVEVIKEMNGLESKNLQLGTELLLPP